jgi:opacity protein-like surface antigen
MKRFIISTSLLFLVLTFSASPQITLQVGGGLGLTSPSEKYAGSTIDFYNGTHYGLGSGFNMHAKARVGLLGLNVFGMIDYSSLSGDGEGEPGRGEVEISHKIFSLKAGPEFNLSIPFFPLGFYFDAFLSMNTISGTVSFQGLTSVPTGEYDIETATRFGAGLGGGVLVDILPFVTLDFGIHYNAYNVFGKHYSTDINSPGRLEVYTSLNDDKDPFFDANEDHIIGESRSMTAWQYTLTVMVGI